MTANEPVLHAIYGKIAAGKSTLATRLSTEDSTVLIAEDDWLAQLFPDPVPTMRDHFRRSAKLRQVLKPHVASILNAGVSVVLDFSANTVESRTWLREILELSKADHQLHVLDVPDEVCLARLRARNASGDHPYAPTEEDFHKISKYVVPPTDAEGLNIVRHVAPS